MLNENSDHGAEIKQFIAGYKRFRARYFCEKKINPLYKKLVAEGQSPNTMVVTCSDARVDPSIILDVLPGELFVVRNVANLVPPYDDDPKHHGTSAALEFAVQTLKVRHIIVLAHSHCSGIRTLLETSLTQKSSFLASWMSIAQAAKEHVVKHYPDLSLAQQAELCEQNALLISLKNLHTFPWIQDKITAGQLSLHAWRFDLASGVISQFNERLNQFESLI
jgi:carbonic anhydrase